MTVTVDDEEEHRQLRAAALKNIESILAARQRAERELLEAKQALQVRTEELEQQRAWFEVTLASIGDAVIATDTHGQVTFLNDVAESMTGWTTAEAQGQPLERVFHIINEDTRALADNPVAKVIASGHVVGLANHTSLVAKDGTEIAIEDSAAPIRDSQGNITGAVVVFHDVTQRRRAERALRTSEERLRAVVAQAAVGIAFADLDGRFLEANQKFCDVLGYAIDELRGLTFLQVTHPEDVAVTAAEVERVNRGESPSYSLEKRYVRKDGATIWSSTTVTLLKHQGSGTFVGIIEDITERKQAEALRVHLAAVVESSDDAILTKTLGGIITTWNPAAQRMFGYEASEMIGKPVTMLIPPDQLDEEPSILARLGRGERIDHYETVRRAKDGTLLNVSLSVSPLKDRHGRIIGASKIVRDITRQKHVESALREQARILEILHLTGTSIASQLDLQAVLQTVTDAATQLSGAQFGAFFYNLNNESGESFTLYALSGAPREAFDKFQLPRNTPVFAPTFHGEGTVRSGDITRDPRYGKVAPHHGMPKGHLPVRSYLAVPVVLRSGEVIGGLFFGHADTNVFTEQAERIVMGVASQAAIAVDNARLFEAAQRELASRQRAEAALRETDRRKDEFLATLAHELRNPLAPIRQAAMISKAASASEAQKRWSHDVISRQVQNMSLLLDDLLDISRVTRGTLDLRTERAELAAVIDAAIETARPSIDAKRHRFTVDVPSQPVMFAADPLRLAQVLSNLLTNAAKYTDSGGDIRLSASCTADHVTICVSDTGIGIPEESLSQVFVMFSQVKSTQDRSEGGLGIGLALAKGLVELHGGTLEVRSGGIDKGSEFIVRLPRRLTAEAAAPRLPAPSGETAKRRVLIADDNRDAAESLAMLLRMDGHEVALAYDGPDALARFQDLLPQVAILDIGMPGLDGYEVARRVRQHSLGRAVLLIAVTGWGQESDKARALAAGFNHHFTKPIEPQRLSELLRGDPPHK